MSQTLPSELWSLIVDLAGDAPSFQERARRELIARGEAVVPSLQAALDAPELGSVGHGRIARLLPQIGGTVALRLLIEVAARARAASDPILQADVIVALGVAKTNEALGELRALLGSTNLDIVKQATIALGQTRAESAVAALATLLQRPEASVRYCAVGALGALASPRAQAILKEHAAREVASEVQAHIREVLG